MVGRRFLGWGGSPDEAERYAPLEPECKVVQFDRPLSPAELEKAASLMRGRPDVELYVYYNASRDLDFLRYFQDVRRLNVQLYELEDISGLSHLRQLEELNFGETRGSFSLRFLESLPSLRKLFIVGHRKDIGAVQGLRELTSLGLSQITLPDLTVVEPLAHLREFFLFLGGTRNLTSLRRLPHLESLSMMRITKMSDLGVLRELESLKTLRLDWMRNVTSLPSLASLSRLQRVELDTMKGLTGAAPAEYRRDAAT
jgi:internalin A